MQNSTMIPKNIKFELQSEVFNTFRCQAAANSLDIDVKKKSVHKLEVNNINIPKEWNVGLIYGASGSGKTTLAKHLFGENIFDCSLDENKSIIDQLPKEFSYEDCANILNGIGLNSVPCWIRPIKTLSNGQKARAEAAYLMCKQDFICIDEWTSVVDRTVAKAMSVCLHKFAKKHNKQIILLSCHYDILEWVKPNWLIDCNKQKYELPKSEDFFFNEREKLEFTIKEVGRETWKYFSKYHYLSEQLPAGKIYLYGIFHEDNQIGFQCFANYTPHKPNTTIIFHSNRTVIHPDYNGLGLGIKLINETSKLLKQKINCRIMAKFSAIPVFKAMKKQPQWIFLGEKRLMGKMKKGRNMRRNGGFREAGVRTFNFEFINK
jgi:energy-coupling factor transporter ATP-binding protein EcfA2